MNFGSAALRSSRTWRPRLVYHGRPFRPNLAKTAHMPRLEFTLTGDYVELHNLLKLMGLADSGGSAKARVAEGEVKVDGKIELRKTCKIRAGQTVLIDDTTIKVQKPK
jgi:ribosome-associated protein